jgi:hypothetical protein
LRLSCIADTDPPASAAARSTQLHLYVKGQFVGGCDIVTVMVQSGELATLLDEKGVGTSPWRREAASASVKRAAASGNVHWRL